MNLRKIFCLSTFFLLSCGMSYIPKPKVIVEGNDPQVSFYATVIALHRTGYKLQAVDQNALTMVTEPRPGDTGYWWQMRIAIASNGHVAIDTISSLDRGGGGEELTHKGIVNRAIDLSRHIRKILIRIKPEKIVADGSALLPSIIVTPETAIVAPGS